MPLFSDTGDDVFIPEPEKEYPLTHYLKLHEMEQVYQAGRSAL
jgi:hypothetical protein